MIQIRESPNQSDAFHTAVADIGILYINPQHLNYSMGLHKNQDVY